MTINDPFESPKLLFDGALNDIKNFESQCKDFLDSCYAIPVEKVNKKTGENIIKYRVIQKIPGHFRVIVSNVINNLRHSLDQSVNCAAIELGATKRNNYFPFAKDANEFSLTVKKRCPSVPPNLLKVLEEFKPYGGGDDLLYSFNRITGANKHQVLLNMNIHVPHLIMNGLVAEFRGPGQVGYIVWDHIKQEVEVARIQPGGQLKCNSKAKLPLFISLGGCQIPGYESANVFLDEVAKKVQGILDTIERETSRLRI